MLASEVPREDGRAGGVAIMDLGRTKWPGIFGLDESGRFGRDSGYDWHPIIAPYPVVVTVDRYEQLLLESGFLPQREATAATESLRRGGTEQVVLAGGMAAVPGKIYLYWQLMVVPTARDARQILADHVASLTHG
jgi:hypothetical protein